MTTAVIANNLVGAGVLLDLAVANRYGLVISGVTLASTDATAVSMSSQFNSLSVMGTVFGQTGAVAITSTAFAPKIYVGAEGALLGDTAISTVGAALKMINHGAINGTTAIALADTDTFTNRIYNDGTIEGINYAIQRNGSGANLGTLTVVNEGLISCDGFGAIFMGPLTNSVEVILNRGQIIGTVQLGLGADTYDGRQGQVFGTVFGGDGADTFYAGDFEDVFDGGSGLDTLILRGAAGVSVSLANDLLNSGTSTGDTYTGIEAVQGSRGNDTIVGDAVSNVLTGGFGNDVLTGKGGADTLNGGAGNDVFVFDTQGAADIIINFNNVGADRDFFRIDPRVYNLPSTITSIGAANYVVRADNLAQDANDVIIFRTTDRSIWLDADGNGGGTAIQIATVGGFVTPLFSDFILF